MNETDADEVVETSDVEEREAEGPYWTHFKTQAAGFHSPHRPAQVSPADVSRYLATLPSVPSTPSGGKLQGILDYRESPRKRVKMYHDHISTPAHPSNSLMSSCTPCLSEVSGHNATPSNLSSPSNISTENDPPGSSCIASTPFAQTEENERIWDASVENIYENNSQDPLLLYSQQPHPLTQPKFLVTPHTHRHSPARETRSSYSPTQFERDMIHSQSLQTSPRSRSAGPAPLFSSPLNTSASHRVESSTPRTHAGGQGAECLPTDLFTPQSSRASYTSFLTPLAMSEPRVPLTSTLPSTPEPDDLSITHLPPLHATSPLQLDDEPLDPELGLQLAHPTRYSLRTRQAKQLNPYAYDKIVYKRQMQSNPDAIVKIVSPMKRRKETEGERNEKTDETLVEEWGVEENVEDEDEWYEHERGRRARRREDTRKNSSGMQEGYPVILQRSLSSDEDEDQEIRQLRREAKRVREEMRKKEIEEKKRASKEENERREEGEAAREKRRRLKKFPVTQNARAREGGNRGQAHATDSDNPRLNRETDRESGSGSPGGAEFFDFGADQVDNVDYGYSANTDYREGQRGEGMNVGSDGPLQVPSSSVKNISSVVLPSDDNQHDPAPSDMGGNDGDSCRSDNQNESDSTSSSAEGMTAKDRKKLRLLKRMYPAAMISRMEKTMQPRQPFGRQDSATTERDSDIEEGPLMPGQTRVRRGERAPSTDFDFRGDPNSSDHESRNLRSDSDLGQGALSESDVEILQRSRLRKQNTPIRYNDNEVVEIWDSEEESSSDDDVDDAKINAWLGDRPGPDEVAQKGPVRVREENLIDWMLTRTRTVGAGKRDKKKKRQVRAMGPVRTHREPRDRNLHIVTSGARKFGNGRQMLLTFEKAQYMKPASSRGERERHHIRSSNGCTAVMDTPYDEPDPDSIVCSDVVEENQFSSTVSMKKRKRHRPRKQGGLYVFPSNGIRITSGARRRPRRMEAITVDFEDEGFRSALAPKPHNRDSILKRIPGRVESNAAAGRVADDPDVDLLIGRQSPPRHNGHLAKPWEQRRHIKLDSDIDFLPSGITFGANTYLGKGWLHELTNLVSGNAEVAIPVAYAAFGFELGPSLTVAEFLTCLTSICDHLVDATGEPYRNSLTDDTRQWEGIMRVVCQLLSWFPTNHLEDCDTLSTVIQDLTLHLISRIEERHNNSTTDASHMDFLMLSIYWFVIELSARIGCILQRKGTSPDMHFLVKFILLLIKRLRGFGLQRTVDSVRNCEDTLDALSASQRAAELWVCLLHLVESCDVSITSDRSVTNVHPFWQMLRQVLQTVDVALHSSLEASEEIWRLIFSLCALSQFSVHGMTTSKPRLPASWEMVAFALKQIRLTAEPDSDESLSERSLDKRDEYIWLITSRCFTLWSRWHWRLDDASAMFNEVVEIFKSRKFANLRREPSDFPGFILENDLRLLSQYRPSDTAFELFLKLIAQAAKDGQPPGNPSNVISPKLTKLLSLAIPVGSVPFTKSTPPSIHELSMLYNRLSSVAIAIHLDPTPSNIRYRMAHARRYVQFKDADDTTRMACIRGMMHFAILMQHRCLPLDEVFTWLSEMTDILVSEYSDIELASKASGNHGTNIARDRAIFSIQVLLGSVRRIIETPQMDPTQSRTIYPDPALLEGPWVTRIFSNSTNLANVNRTGLEIRRLVQAFLDARAVIMPGPPRPHPSDGNPESQDEYGMFELDLDDPELLAALGEQADSQLVAANKAKDELVCQVIDKHISPAIYRLVCKHFNDPLDTNSMEDYCHDADKWIDCWVGCANVVVQNRKRDWSLYLTLGPQSWERIIDSSWRRRVGLRFMYMLLRLDPPAYTKYQDRFMEVLLESLVSAKVTLESAYASLLFSTDGLQHPLIRGVPCQRNEDAAEYDISNADFLALRLPIIETMCKNLNGSLQEEANGDKSLVGHNQTCVGFFVTMSSTMQDIHEKFEARSLERGVYTEFCRQVFEILVRYPRLKSQHRLLNWMNWGRAMTRDIVVERN